MIDQQSMGGIWLENQTIEFRDDLPLPSLEAGEALIRVRLAGICGTDLQLLKGYYPFTGIPGHEFVGEVVQAPEAPQLIDQRVVGEINVGCGQCALCNTGLNKHCRQRSVLGMKNHHGAFAEFLRLPVANLHIVPDQIPDEKAVFTEPVAAAAHILEQVNIKPDSNVLVIGAGRLGLLISQVIKTTQCQLRVVVRHDKQRQILEQFGIRAIGEQQLPKAEADVVIEACGSPSGLRSAIDAVKPLGSIVLKSTYAGETDFDFSRIVVDEINLIGSRCGNFETALRLLQYDIDPMPLISCQYGFNQVRRAFEAAKLPGALKVLLHS